MNVVESLKKATDFLSRRDVTSPRLNAELMLSCMLGLSRVDLYTGFDRELTEEEAGRFKEMLMKRAGGCPLQYLTGETGFYSATFLVCPGVFIPRPETEVLVEKALDKLPERPVKVLDVGTGNGCIAISIALTRPGAEVLATDISAAALVMCNRNADRLGVTDKVGTALGDLYEPIGATERFDMVISNPPYICSTEAEELDVEVREFEPPQALYAGEDGLEVIRKLVAGAPAHLKPEGVFAMEIGEKQGKESTALLEEAGFDEVELTQDLAGRDRVVTGKYLK